MSMVANKTSATTVTFSNPQEIVISHADDSIKIGDGTDLLAVNADGSINVKGGVISTSNSTTTPLSSGATFQGSWEDISDYASISVIANASHAGTLYALFSTDGSNTDRTVQLSDTNSTDLGSHSLTPVAKYLAIKLVNGGTNQTSLRIQTLFNKGARIAVPTSRLAQTLGNYSDVLNVRAVLVGETDGGDYYNVPVTSEGHIEMALREPLLPFGSVHSEKLRPIFQSDAVYGINTQQVQTTTSGTGGATASDSCFVVSTGTTSLSQGVIQSRKRLRYRPGQGVVGRFTALYTSPVADSYQLVGVGHTEDGVYIGYKNTDFGILYTNRGARAVYTLTVTTRATSAANATVELNGISTVVALTAASNIQRTVWELSQATYTDWDAYPSGATVIFVRKAAGTTAGAFSYAAGTTGSAASIAQTRAGASETQSFIAQSSFSIDKLDGTGPSGITIDTTKLNVFQIGIQYLGSGAITFKIENAPAGNNASWVTFHVIALPNTLTAPSFRNPSFPFTMAAYSTGSTTNLTVKSASFAGFIEGDKALHGPRFSYYNQLTTVGAANYQCIFTVMNQRYFGGIANQAVINLISVSGAIKHTSPVIYYLIKNGSLAGNPNFTSLASNSCSLQDTAATTVTGGELLWTGHVGDAGEIDHHFNGGTLEDLTLQPGEWVTLAAKATTGTPSYVTGSINTREDQ